MKEDAGEEDATRPPFGLYPHVLGLRLVSFLDQFVHPPNREIKEDPRDRPEEVTPRPEIRFAVVVLACVEINQCVGCRQFFTKSPRGDGAAFFGSVER